MQNALSWLVPLFILVGARWCKRPSADFSGGDSGSRSRGPMTLRDAVTYALDHSQTVSTQQADVTQAQHNLALQRGIAYPTVNGKLQSWLSKSANYEGAYAVIGQSQENVFSQNTAQIGITNWNLTSGGFAFLGVAACARRRSRLEYVGQHRGSDRNQRKQLVLQNRPARSGRLVVQAALKYQNALTVLAKVKVKAGVAAGVDVLQALTSAAKSESALVADQAAVEDARKHLRSKSARRFKPNSRPRTGSATAASTRQRRLAGHDCRGVTPRHRCGARGRSRRQLYAARLERRALSASLDLGGDWQPVFANECRLSPKRSLAQESRAPAAQLFRHRSAWLAWLLVHSSGIDILAAYSRLQRSP